MVSKVLEQDDPRISPLFETDIKNTLYNIERAKQVLNDLIGKVSLELSEQRRLDKFYDKGLQHVESDTGELLL